MVKMMGDAEYQVGDAYGNDELAEVLKQYGLTPSPIPQAPFEVQTPDGGLLFIREAMTAANDDHDESLTEFKHYHVRYTR